MNNIFLKEICKRNKKNKIPFYVIWEEDFLFLISQDFIFKSKDSIFLQEVNSFLNTETIRNASFKVNHLMKEHFSINILLKEERNFILENIKISKLHSLKDLQLTFKDKYQMFEKEKDNIIFYQKDEVIPKTFKDIKLANDRFFLFEINEENFLYIPRITID